MSSQNIHRIIGAATSSSSSSSPSLLLILLLLLIIISDNTDGAPDTTLVSAKCEPNTYNEGDPYGALVSSVLDELKQTTPEDPYHYKYVTQSDETSTVQGYAECNGDLVPNDCKQCLEQVIVELRNLCAFAVYATLDLEDCEMKYENIAY